MLMSPSEEYFEFPTLDSLHSFCSSSSSDPDATVFYFHTKTDDKQREEMGAYLFGGCRPCMEGGEAVLCGRNFRDVDQVRGGAG
mmetsp:Transcript_27192/g.54287  ORF Transcript_27192/g.54287 Transcript_27192/m.54287 type:complete len:84 (-) Transcript_27192:7-258(-)